jgi:hypothetical protein
MGGIARTLWCRYKGLDMRQHSPVVFYGRREDSGRIREECAAGEGDMDTFCFTHS